MATAAAIAGVGALGAWTTKEAAKTGAKAQTESAAQIQQAAEAARRDVLKLFPQAQAALLGGSKEAFNILGQSIPLQQQQLSQGNLAAQQTVAQGFDQAQAALLGLPTTQFAPQGVDFETQPLFTPRFSEGYITPLEGGQTLSVPTYLRAVRNPYAD